MHRQCVWVLLLIINGIFAQDSDTISIETEDLPECKPINGAAATCVSINKCPSAKNLLENQNVKTLQERHCGFIQTTPLVCCETPLGLSPVRAPAPTSTSTPLPSTLAIEQYLLQEERVEPIVHPLLPDKTLCGVQVIKDSQTEKNLTQIQEYPWVSALYYRKGDGGEKVFKCSGTLISGRYVLTAARCLFLEGYELIGVRLGEWRFSTITDCINNKRLDEAECLDPVDIPIVEKNAHVFYNNTTGANDIAVLRLERKVTFSEYIRPICLPPKNLSVPQLGTVLTASGWGLTESGTRSDIKLKLNLSLISDQECNKSSKDASAGPCIQRAENLPFCNGESGGSLLKLFDRFDEDDITQWYQEGIIYRGLGCRQAFGQYTRVSKYIDWILSNLKV